MSLANEIVKLYTEHKGTVRISGRTQPRAAGFCAFSHFKSGVSPIDFFYIGGNAGQQAMKAMGILSHLVHELVGETGSAVAFIPLRFRTHTKDLSGGDLIKDATVWRVVIVQFTCKDQLNEVTAFAHYATNNPNGSGYPHSRE